MGRRLLSIAFGVVFVSIILSACFDNIKNGNREPMNMMIPIPGGAVGPESLAFDVDGGGPYTGVSDGRIIRWLANESRWVDFAVTSPERNGCEGPHDHSQREHICGRPLGLRFNEQTGHLYIADAYMGLLVAGPNGGLSSPLTKEVDGLAFKFTNSLDIDHDTGDVYFTDSSQKFSRRDYVSVIISGDNSGRLMKFEARMNKSTLVLDNLKFPNGIALSKSGDFLLFVETTTCRLYKLWLKTQETGNVQLIAQFPGFPDNIKRNRNGEFWVGINSTRGKLLEWIISKPWIGNVLLRLFPLNLTKIHLFLARLFPGNGMGIRLDRDGNVVEVVDSSKTKTWKFVSEVDEHNRYLWIASVIQPFLLRQNMHT